MKILMISDLHICDDTDDYLKTLFHIIDKMFDIINQESIPTEELIIAICGDIIDQGNDKYYSSAIKVFEYLKQKSGSRKIEFVMVPGNHDLCNKNFKSFDEFCESYQHEIRKFDRETCYSKNIDPFNFILANSTYHKDWTYGKVDTEAIDKNTSPYLNNILITHHSTISEDDNDTANIRNIPRLLNVINNKNIVYHFHGHTHGTYCTRIGNNCKSLGVGAMFFKAKEMGSQFNILTIENGDITKACNYLYRIDQDKYIPDPIYIDNNIKSNKYSAIDNKYLNYKKPKDYITRKVGPFNMVQRGGVTLIYNKEQIKSLREIICEKKRIVLLGEAGSGKSYELSNLAYDLMEEKKVTPLFIQLNTYVDETIEKLIKSFSTSNNKIILIFDGYDEIEDKNLNTFAKRLNAFVKDHPKQEIIVSTRNNFYKNALDETNIGTFNDFFEYALCPLSNSDVVEYLKKKNIDNKQFLDKIKSKNLKEQIQNPFFLIQLVDLYICNNDLPEMDELMDELIYKRFEEDQTKYLTAEDIEGQKSDIIYLLKKLAFAMQCLKKNHLDSGEYQSLVQNDKRNLLKYSGIWCKNNKNQWQFEHNNFREFLAAKYLANRSLNDIKKLVTYSENTNEIKMSWSNTLSFLILIYTQKSLINWLISIAPFIIVGFETSRISLSIRTKVLCTILEEYKKNNMWISRNQNSVEELARFGQSPKSINYLINVINNPCNFRALSNAINIIGAITNFYGEVNTVRRALLKCCFNLKTRNYEIEAAILALTNLELHNENDIKAFLSYFSDENDSEIRYAIYCYIIEFDLQESAIDYVLDGIKILKNRIEQNISEKFRLQEILESLKTFESIHKVFKYIIQEEDYYQNMNYFGNAFKVLFDKAENLFNEGNYMIFDDIVKIFIKASLQCEHRSVNATKKFLVNTNKVFDAYKFILENIKNENIIYILENLMNENCIDDFLNRYKNDTLENKEYFISFVRRYRKGNYKYNELRKAILEKDGIVIEEIDSIDYNSIKKQCEQQYFDALFVKEKFQNLIMDLTELCNGNDTLYNDLNHIPSEKIEKRYDLDKIRWNITKNEFKDQKVVNFLNYVDWEEFSMILIYNEIKSQKYISVSIEQKKVITEYCLNAIEKIDFEKEFTFRKDGTTLFSLRAVCCIYFAEKFLIKYSRSVLLNMLMVPAFVFKKEKTENAIFPNYILKYLSKKEIECQVCKNLKEKSIQGTLAEMYIRYCTENHLRYAIDLSASIMTDTDYADWIRRLALKYLISILGENYVVKKYLLNADKILLDLLVDELLMDKNEQLIQRLIAENQASDDGLLYLKSLILIGNEYGLKKYYDIAKKIRTLPDISSNDGISPITESIGEVSDANNIQVIIDLALLVLEKDFKDKRGFGLYNSVSKAVNNIAEINPETVLKYLEKAKIKNQDNEEFLSFCNNNILEIKIKFYNQKDLPWDIDKIKKYMHE